MDTRPLIRSLSNDQLRSYITKKYADRKIFYQQSDVLIDDEGVSLQKVIDNIFHN